MIMAKLVIKPTDPVDSFAEEIMKFEVVTLQTQGKQEPVKSSTELVEKAKQACAKQSQEIEQKIKQSSSLVERIEK